MPRNTSIKTDRLTGIAIFVQAAEAGSFSLAAERLRLTRSAVGKSIARLEERLGVRLFLRTTRQQTLTADGQAFHDHCVRALAELVSGGTADATNYVTWSRMTSPSVVDLARGLISP